jgi:energy-converting hydrogenase Eha subunit B
MRGWRITAQTLNPEWRGVLAALFAALAMGVALGGFVAAVVVYLINCNCLS